MPHRTALLIVLPFFFHCLLAASSVALGQTNAAREWTDSTGQFKVTATLVEVKDGKAYLRTADGKTMRIPRRSIEQ